MQQHQFVQIDAALPSDHMIMEGVDPASGPTFTVSEVGEVFFARSAHWVRWREKNGDFVLDGEEVGTRRSEKDFRVYTLTDVEKMAHALASTGAIDGNQLNHTLHVVQAVARLWALI